MRLLLILISLLFFSCGTRRTELEASKTNVSATSSKTTDIDIKNDIKKNVAVSAAEHSRDTEKDIEIIEEFGDDGRLKKRIYREKAKQKEKSKQRDSVGSTVDKSTLEIKETEKNKTDSLSKNKDKKTTADKTAATNVGGAGWFYTIVISLAVLVGVFWFVKRKLNPT
jgi:vacuolar-type H+-ATPase subunit I/STV1